MSSSFKTTRWTLVVRAADSQSGEGRSALENLCRAYWQPLFAYVRSHGKSREDAEDLTQAFFQQLLSEKLHARADRDRGRFRTFLLAMLRNFMLNEHRHQTAKKRGGADQAGLPLDEVPEEEASLKGHESPDRIFERKFAHAVLAQALERLRLEHQSGEQQKRFEILKPLLYETSYGAGNDEKVAAELGITPSAARAALTRMRQRFREQVREEVTGLVDDPADVDDEIAHMIQVLRG